MTRDHNPRACAASRPRVTMTREAVAQAGMRRYMCVYMGALCGCNANAFNRICVSIALQRGVAAAVGG